MAEFFSRESLKGLDRLRQLKPDLFKGFMDWDGQVFKAGAIPVKYKELMALAVAHTTQCPWCIDIHTGRAKQAGVTDEEIAEAVFVAMAMRAGASLTHGTIAMNTAQEHQHK